MSITDEEYSEVIDAVCTHDILNVVDKVDELRGYFSDDFEQGCVPRPPEIRQRLLELHEIGMDAINRGHRGKLKAFFDLTEELSMELFQAHEQLEEAWKLLEKINDAVPEHLCDDEDEEENDQNQ